MLKQESEWVQVCGGSSIPNDFFTSLEQIIGMGKGVSTYPQRFSKTNLLMYVKKENTVMQ